MLYLKDYGPTDEFRCCAREGVIDVAYRYTKTMIPYSKMPLAKLKEIEADILNNYPDLEARLTLCYEEQKKINNLKEEYKSVQKRIDEITNTAVRRKKEEYAVTGRLKRFLMDRTSPNFTEAELNELGRLRHTQSDLHTYLQNPNSNKFQSAFFANEKLQLIRRHISKIERMETKTEKEEAKRNADKAVIAAYKGKSRSLADQIKFELKEQLNLDSHCPYCGRDMGDGPHCDHIYPVSKGGLSTAENMVYICSDCNLKKSGLTLTQFIKKYNFLRVDIERRLEKLGKDY